MYVVSHHMAALCRLAFASYAAKASYWRVGLPIVVARRTLQNTAGLIGRSARTPAEAAAGAADGANLIILEVCLHACMQAKCR